jgi:hypothetical protein
VTVNKKNRVDNKSEPQLTHVQLKKILKFFKIQINESTICKVSISFSKKIRKSLNFKRKRWNNLAKRNT